MIVQACLNGRRLAASHPRLPQRVDDLVRDAIEVVAAGASELHLHVYGDLERESLDPAAVDPLMRALRRTIPGALIGISTGGWIEGDDEHRLACIAGWSVLPDHASVNLDEPGALDVIWALHRRGIGVEAGLSSPEDAGRLIESGLAPLALRLLVEIGDVDPGRAFDLADQTLAMLAQLESPKPILLHGFDETAWPFVERALDRRCSTRIGLEDTLRLADGAFAASNAELVAAAVAMRAERHR